MAKTLLGALTLTFLLLPSSAVGQAEYAVDQGAFVLGGDVSWSTSGGDFYESAAGDRRNSILINPSVLYFIVPGLAIGGDLYVESTSQGDFDATTIAVGPAIAYFFGGADSSVYPYIGTSVGYGQVTTSGFDGSGLVFTATGGVAIMLSQSVALTAGASYQVENFTVDQLNESFSGNVFALEIGVEAFLF